MAKEILLLMPLKQDTKLTNKRLVLRGSNMKIINLGRQQGKTTRLLYASEMQNIPILCPAYPHKQSLMYMAKELGLNIPEPIYVGELFRGSCAANKRYKDVLVDEAPWVLQMLLRNIGIEGEVKAITLTSDER